jgi:hypothetical protein
MRAPSVDEVVNTTSRNTPTTTKVTRKRSKAVECGVQLFRGVDTSADRHLTDVPPQQIRQEANLQLPMKIETHAPQMSVQTGM